jgi:hypothetical protein
MPKLPEALGTPDSLGVVPPDPSRLIPRYEAGQVGAAAQGFGRDLGQAGAQLQDTQDRLARAAAEQDFISQKLDLDQQFASDPDYATAPQRYRQALLQALNQTSQGILGPVQRAGFQQQMSRFTEAGVDAMLRQSQARSRAAGRADVVQAADTTVIDALRATDDLTRNQIFGAINDRIQASTEAGYVSPDEAYQLRRGTAMSYASQRGWQLADADPQQALETLSATGTSDDGSPVFAKAGDWRDLIDPGERQNMVQRSEQNLDTQQRAAEIETLRQQRQQQKQESDAASAIASRYVNTLASDPTSVDVAALARERFPDSQQATRQALLGAAETAIAQGGAKDYGSGFWPAFNRVTAAEGDPDKIDDLATVLKLAGPEGSGQLTMPGVQQLLRFLSADATPETRAQSAIEQNFLCAAHAEITGTEAPADPASETRFQNFLGAYFPARDAGLDSGKSSIQLFSPASADSLGKLIPAFAPSAARSESDQTTQNTPAAQGTPAVDPLAAAQWADGIAHGGGPPQPQPISALPPSEPAADNDFIDKVGRVLQAAGAGATAGYGSGPVGFSPELMNEPWAKAIFGSPGARNIVQTLNKVGIEGTYELGQVVLRAANAIYFGGVDAGTQALVEAGVNGDDAGRLARDLKGMPEAFMGNLGTLREPILSLPKFDRKTLGILFTNEGQIIELKSGPPDPAYARYPAAKHVEGKAAIWIRENGSSGGVLFHNNPKGACLMCNSNIPTLLPEGATLSVLPEAAAMARRSWTDIRKAYTGNSAQPLAPE